MTAQAPKPLDPRLREWFLATIAQAPVEARALVDQAIALPMSYEVGLPRQFGPLPEPLAADFASFWASQGFGDLRASIQWRQSELPGDPAYSSGNSYCQLFGAADADGFGAMGGFYLLGPRLHYPNHRHQGVEGYVLLSGEMEWAYDDGPWLCPSAERAVLVTPSRVAHQMRSGQSATARSAITAWFWWGQLDASDWEFC